MDEQLKNLYLRISIAVVVAALGGYYIASDYGYSGIDGRLLGLSVLAFGVARLSRPLLLGRKYPAARGLSMPRLNGPLYGSRRPIQTELDIVLVAFSIGIGAIVTGILLAQKLSVGGILGIAWGLGDYTAIRAFIKKHA